jgi:nucleoside-diphosphate-sugar epimerase
MIVARLGMVAQNPWFVIGCGYTGARLVRALVAAGYQDVTLTRRDRAEAEHQAGTLGVRGVRVELADPSTLRDVVPPDAIVVCLAPPALDPAAEIAGLIAGARHAARIVYISSTAVYPAAAGAWVDETWPVAPHTAAGRKRAAAEAALALARVPRVALRVAGIYGPERGIAERIRTGSYRVIGDGTSHVSRIHVDDLVTAIVAAGLRAGVGEAVNIADDDPAPIGEVADAIAAALGAPPPPRVPPDQVDPEIAGMLTANRRIANARMKHDLGVALRYPSWRTTLPAAPA